MALRLEGILSYIDNYKRLKVVFDDVDESDTTRKKLVNCCRADHRPFDETEFTVCLPKTIKDDVPDDIRALLGLRVIIHAKPVPYSFVSKLEKNKGERVKGVQLTLVNITRA